MDNFISDIKKPVSSLATKTGFLNASHNNYFKQEDSYHFQPPQKQEITTPINLKKGLLTSINYQIGDIDHVSIHT